MYQAYAADPQMRINVGIRRRLAPLMENSRRRIELLNSPALLVSGHAGDLLRRRDRHGRQHLPRRSQRRADADAVDRRPQRRVLARRSGAALCAADHGSGLRLSGGERRGAGAIRRIRCCNWMKRLIALRKQFKVFGRGTLEFLPPQNRKVLAYLRRYDERAGPLRRESVADAAAGRARSVGIRRHDAGGDARPDASSRASAISRIS